MCEKICKTCGGEDDIAKIARMMGFRPDVAFMRIRELEKAICIFLREEMGDIDFESDEQALNYILSYLHMDGE